jgi:alkyl sulfatase BDS1-like metallo-beta-lactamase superfamily hydrolase
MRRLDPEFLVPSHTQPLRGREVIQKQLRDYRDGIQWVYVSTVRGANAGRTVDDLAETVCACVRAFRDAGAGPVGRRGRRSLRGFWGLEQA